MDTYEKKYKEALELARVAAFNGHQSLMEGIFPELKESEDEKIRKELIDIVAKSPITFAFEDKKKVLAWLEKQSEQKPTLPKWKYKKDNTTLLKDSLVLNKCGHMAKLSSGAIVSDVWVLDYDELAKLPKEELEEQGEQKPQRMISAEAKEAMYDKPACAWSGEDEKILKDILVDVKFEGYNNDMLANSYKKINWLKSLRQRIGG